MDTTLSTHSNSLLMSFNLLEIFKEAERVPNNFSRSLKGVGMTSHASLDEPSISASTSLDTFLNDVF